MKKSNIKKILILGPDNFLPADKDGVNKTTYNIIRALDESLITFIYPTKKDQIATEVCPPLKELSHVEIAPIAINQTSISKPLRKLLSLFSARPYLCEPSSTCKAIAQRVSLGFSNNDLMIIIGLQYAQTIMFLPLDIQKKCILIPIDCLTLFYRTRIAQEKNPLKHLALKLDSIKGKLFEKRLYPLAYKSCFVSQRDTDMAEMVSKAKCETIPYGLDFKEFTEQSGLPPEIPPKDKDIIFTGNMNYGPNLHAAQFLVNSVMPLVLKKDPDIRLILAGGSPPKNLLRSQSDNIIVTGFVNSLAPFIKNAKIYVSPLFYGAGIKNKILEAMSLGSIVVGSPESFHAIQCRAGQDVIQIDKIEDPETWTSHIIDILSNYDAYKDIGINARKSIQQHHEWSKIEHIYRTKLIQCQ